MTQRIARADWSRLLLNQKTWLNTKIPFIIKVQDDAFQSEDSGRSTVKYSVSHPNVRGGWTPPAEPGSSQGFFSVHYLNMSWFLIPLSQWQQSLRSLRYEDILCIFCFETNTH